jgi:hypothetical protein
MATWRPAPSRSLGHVRATEVDKGQRVTESIAEGLSVAGLVVGFPLLLLALMLSLQQLESWGLRGTEPERTDVPEMPDPIGEAIDGAEHRAAVEAEGEHAQSTSGSAHR